MHHTAVPSKGQGIEPNSMGANAFSRRDAKCTALILLTSHLMGGRRANRLSMMRRRKRFSGASWEL